jgi:hypothetical protein
MLVGPGQEKNPVAQKFVIAGDDIGGDGGTSVANMGNVVHIINGRRNIKFVGHGLILAQFGLESKVRGRNLLANFSEWPALALSSGQKIKFGGEEKSQEKKKVKPGGLFN